MCGTWSHKIETVTLRKYPYDHWLTNKAYLNAITVTSIFWTFACKMAVKTGWHIYRMKLRHYRPMYWLRFSRFACHTITLVQL